MIFSISEFNSLINNESHLGISLFFRFSKYDIIEQNNEYILKAIESSRGNNSPPKTTPKIFELYRYATIGAPGT